MRGESTISDHEGWNPITRTVHHRGFGVVALLRIFIAEEQAVITRCRNVS